MSTESWYGDVQELTDSFLLEMLEEGLARRKLLCMLFDHCCCRCRHGCVANGSSSCAPLEACRGLDFCDRACATRERSVRILAIN